MIIHNDEQGSPAWHAARAGVITASQFSTARDTLKSGQPSAAAKAYAFRLALERIGKQPLDDGYGPWAMKRGHEIEPIARAALSKRLGADIVVPGFITDDTGTYGASADGFIGDDGGCEIKCLVDPSRIRKVLLDGDLSEFEDQIQGCMWITGRKWWEYCLYLPQLAKAGMDLYTKRVYRDEGFISKMASDLATFDQMVKVNEVGVRSNLAPRREDW